MANKDRVIAIAGCCAALGTLVPVALYQAGVLDELPDPPGDIFDSNRITSSKTAHPLGVPDAYLGLASYATTLALVLLAKRHPGARRLLGVKLAGDAGLATFNVIRQVVSFGKICSWCTGTALATAVTVYGGRDTLRSEVKSLRQEL